ncbi:MAG: hypothetical protein H2174_10380 [Vampirovibrio sp.]|nr:hypothetical protein [Vampirovibrio sp.]
MQTFSLLPTQIQNRVGLQQQPSTNNPPYPADTYGNFQPPAGNIDSYNPSAQGAAQPTAPYEMPSNQQPIASPAYAAPLAVAAAPVSFWKKPVTWVLGGAGAVGLGALAYFKLDWIKDKLGIGGNEGKLERAKTQFEALKTDFKNAETDEAKKKIVTKMLAVLERNDGALLNKLPKGALNAYATELRALKDSGNKFAQTALTKAGKEIVKNAKQDAKNVLNKAGEAINNSGAVENLLKVVAIPATFLFGSAFLMVTGLGPVIAGLGTAVSGVVAANAPAVGASISGLATGLATNTAVQATALGTGTAVSGYTVFNPKPVKSALSWIAGIPSRLFKGLRGVRA